ncbi:polar amino acid ABC transporter permease [Candidatus Geothermarchaeota archaeon ex4572_27]|nr:MAG: polar amino acid ABC transporter permease [Candidatus Geothermarchaeota archaeon ex4572_27]
MTLEELLFLAEGIYTTLLISILSFVIGFAIGASTAIARQFAPRAAAALIEGYEKVFMGVPVLVIMLFVYFGLGGLIPLFKDAFLTSVAALGLRSGAYQGRIFHGAINSVGRDQVLAAYSLGMDRLSVFRHVILPQAFIVALPGLGSEMALLIKDSSYAFLLGVLELAKRADIIRAATRSFMYPYLCAALIYIALTFPIANYLDRLGSRLKARYGLR